MVGQTMVDECLEVDSSDGRRMARIGVGALLGVGGSMLVGALSGAGTSGTNVGVGVESTKLSQIETCAIG